MFRIGFLSFLVGFIIVGAACSSKPAPTPIAQTPAPTASSSPSMDSMRNPDDSEASTDVPLSIGTDLDSLQNDLDNTDLETLNSISSQVQAEITQQ